VEVGVRKQEMWELENWSIRLRYLRWRISFDTATNSHEWGVF